MRKLRGFKLGRKLIKICKWVFTPKRKKPSGYIRLNHHPSLEDEQRKTKKGFGFWGGGCWKKRFWSNCNGESKRLPEFSYGCEVGQKPVKRLGGYGGCDGFKGVPKGHLAVYVGQKDDQHRFLVPVIYFNHPLFGQLLREAEEEYGYHHPGGITIPCGVSDFKNVQTRIAGEKRVKPAKRRFR